MSYTPQAARTFLFVTSPRQRRSSAALCCEGHHLTFLRASKPADGGKAKARLSSPLPSNSAIRIFPSPIDRRYRSQGTRLFLGSTRSSHHVANIEPSAVSSYLEGLNPSQIEAVTRPVESLTRVVAGPGAGKTRVLTSRIAYLLQNDTAYNPHSRILAVTFTKKASMEMQNRLQALLQADAEQNVGALPQMDSERTPSLSYSRYKHLIDKVTLGTFHSVCSKILRSNGRELSNLPSVSCLRKNPPSTIADVANNTQDISDMATLDGNYAIVDASDQMRIVKECMKELGIVLKNSHDGKARGDIKPVTIVNAVGTLKLEDASTCSLSCSNANTSQKSGRKMSAEVRKIAKKVYPLYQSALYSRNSLDFDDLILLTRELLFINSIVRERLHRRWKHVLVDEFQDTSLVQLDLIKLLTTRSLLVVGDGNQSIYSWRGAHAESMSDFVTEFEAHDPSLLGARPSESGDSAGSGDMRKVDTVYLLDNYRSTTNIVKAAQKIIDSTSLVSTNVDDRQDMKSMRGSGPTPRVRVCADSKEEATFIVKSIISMLEKGDLTFQSSVAIIYRTNAQSRAFEEACVLHNLMYLLRGAEGKFYSRAEVKDCLCFLRWIYNGRDRTAMMRAVKTPSRGIGDVTINEFLRYCELVETDFPGKTPLDILISLTDSKVSGFSHSSVLPTRITKRFVQFSKQMQQVCRSAEVLPVSELISEIIAVMDLKTHIDSISKSKDEFEDRWGNVNELQGAAERYTKDGPALPPTRAGDDGKNNETEAAFFGSICPLGNFLDDVSLLTDLDSDSESNQPTSGDNRRLMVNLMTIHASKGLEFDAVFLAGCEEGTFPTQRAIAAGSESVEIREEKRLCYVAMTRSKTHLVFTWRRKVMVFQGQGVCVVNPKRSQFLDILMSTKSKLNDMGENCDNSQQHSISLNKTTTFNQFNGKAQQQTLLGKTSAPSSKVISRLTSIPSRSSIPSKSSIPRSPQGGSWQDWKPFSSKTPVQGFRRGSGETANRAATGRNIIHSRLRSPSGVNGSQMDVNANASLPEIDSTVFFPVGTFVFHGVHGTGRVLSPPPSSSLQVRVQFESGMEVDFPMSNGGLTIKF